ncbi:DNA repair protein RadC [Candidatus Woesearchaeota archaeon]|nr:DNA repair protein RadC [Candidatus Woesearchaeota archaeon]
MKIREISKEERPRERLEQLGASALSDAELLALLLSTGTPGENVIEMSRRLLAQRGLSDLSACSLAELQALKGIGFAKACQIAALFELQKRVKIQDAKKKPLRSAKDVFLYCAPRLSCADKEQFLVLFLDTKNRVIKERLISIGTLDASLIHPREVFKAAIKESARSVLFVHNHPSGDPTPSPEDECVTKALFEAGDLLGIPVLDHIIIGKEKWWSFKEER